MFSVHSTKMDNYCRLNSGGEQLHGGVNQRKGWISAPLRSQDKRDEEREEVQSKGKLDDTLGFFLRAIDIKPGDPEAHDHPTVPAAESEKLTTFRTILRRVTTSTTT